VFSLAQGTFHAYYTVALAPGIAALIGIGGAELWRHRGSWAGRTTLAVVLAGTAAWAWVLLARTPDYLPWLRWTIAVVAALTVLAVLLGRSGKRITVAVALAAVLTGLAAPTAYAVTTAATPHTGSIPLAGPSTGTSRFGGGGGGPGGDQTADAALVTLLQDAGTTWSAAASGAMGGASLALASGTDVLSIGGFTGSDPAPTLDQFKAYVAAGEVRYFVEGGGGPGGRGGHGGAGSEISTWVQQTFSSTTVGGRTVYDLTQPQS
jgi:4-amino-4-deoxy-L-arabinose transferase-like glycosyltransferase